MTGFPHNPVNRKKSLSPQTECFEPQKCQLAKFEGILQEDLRGKDVGTLQYVFLYFSLLDTWFYYFFQKFRVLNVGSNESMSSASLGLFIFGFIYLFLTLLGLPCFADISLVAANTTTLGCSVGTSQLQGLPIAKHRLQGTQASAVAAQAWQCGIAAWLPCAMWHLPGSGIEPVSPVWAGGFFTRSYQENPLYSFSQCGHLSCTTASSASFLTS